MSNRELDLNEMRERANRAYRECALRCAPAISAVIVGTHTASPNSPYAAAWIIFSTYYEGRPVDLHEIIATADGIGHAIPLEDELVWAFYQMKGRGWLQVDGNRFSISPSGSPGIRRRSE